MRHRNAYYKLGLKTSHRTALLRNLLTALVDHERIESTQIRCKALKREADKLVTLGKRGTLHHRRLAARILYREDLVNKLFDSIAPRFKDRAGGYTRIVQIGRRRGDAAPMAIVEFVGYELPVVEAPAPAPAKKAE